ncbi:MAG: tetratricopeptide repeat protein, partial [Candidatus Hodarchaeota archaeon]
MRADDQWPDSSRQTLQELTGKATPGIIVVSVAMFFLFILNVDDFSPQGKFVPDYSIYIIIAFGFVLFYFLNFSLRYVSVKKMEMLLKPSAVGVLILLVGIGATKIYQVYAAYRKAVRVEAFMGKAGSGWKTKWREVLELNRIPGIESISTRATVELAKIRTEQGDFKQASNYYKKILADQVFNFEANLGVAEIGYEQKDWRIAYKAYKRAIYLRPKERILYSPYIHACIKEEKLDHAIDFVTNLKEIRPISLYEPEDYLIIGDALLRKRRIQK